MGKTAHILAVSAGHGDGLMAPPLGFTPLQGGLANAVGGNAWFGPRQHLETLKPLHHEHGMGTAANLLDRVSAIAEGFSREAADGLTSFLGHIRGTFGAETANVLAYPSMLQIIPYVMFRWRGTYLRYLRTTTGGDERLHGLISIGIGGHVDLNDAVVAADGSIDVVATLDKAFRREGKEEVGIDVSKTGPRWIATLYAKDTEVDTVHLGIVGVYDLSDVEKEQIEANHEIGDHAFRTLAEIKDEATGDVVLETWTRLVIDSNPLA